MDFQICGAETPYGKCAVLLTDKRACCPVPQHRGAHPHTLPFVGKDFYVLTPEFEIICLVHSDQGGAWDVAAALGARTQCRTAVDSHNKSIGNRSRSQAHGGPSNLRPALRALWSQAVAYQIADQLDVTLSPEQLLNFMLWVVPPIGPVYATPVAAQAACRLADVDPQPWREVGVKSPLQAAQWKIEFTPNEIREWCSVLRAEVAAGKAAGLQVPAGSKTRHIIPLLTLSNARRNGVTPQEVSRWLPSLINKNQASTASHLLGDKWFDCGSRSIVADLLDAIPLLRSHQIRPETLLFSEEHTILTQIGLLTS